MKQKIFVSGASGLIGGNCLRHFKSLGAEVVGSHLSFPTPETVAFNTLEPDASSNFNLRAFRPDFIIHCGALTWVDYCEEHPEESFEKTVKSTENLLKICSETGARMLYLSSDYVFDGKEGPYTENAATNPLSVYGKHKLEAEHLVTAHSDKHLIFRVTNVYGDEIRMKNFIARIIKQATEHVPLQLNLPYDQFASPVNAHDVARAAYLLISDNKSGLYHIASSDYLNRVQLALRVLKYYPDAEYQLSSHATSSLNQAANRPLLGGLIARRLLEEYPQFEFSNVDDYLSAKLAENF